MLARTDILTARARCEALSLAHPPGTILEKLARRPDPAVLESSARHQTYGRHTIMACDPLEVLTLRDGVLSDAAGNTLADGDNVSIWAALSRGLSAVRACQAGGPAPYLPGWIGYVGYEVGRHVEKLPSRAPRDTALPDLRLAFYDALLIYDTVEARWSVVELEFDDPPPGAGLAGKRLRTIAAAAHGDADETPPAPAEHADPTERPAAGAEANFSAQAYQAAVAKCVDYIAAGDIFQVNLSQRFTVSDAPEPLAMYRALRRRNPAWYAAYLSFTAGGDDCAVVSSSPELFLRVRGDHVITRPIKGTRPRTGRDERDAVAAAELITSPKDNAELAMIIDLMRNDLGRVCRYGTVRVTEARALETHPTVYHLVGTVEGRTCERVGPAELLRATFPGGSITGAPKIRAMEIIDELEPVARGVYTGCIGIVGVDGSCEWNLAIRTIVCDAGRALVQAGGGIVADSDPAAEYRETLDKARALLEAIAEARINLTPTN